MPAMSAPDELSPMMPAANGLASPSGSLTLPPMLMAAIHANVIRFYDLCLLVRESQEEIKLLNEQYKDLASDAINHDATAWLLSNRDTPAMEEWEAAHPDWQCCGTGIRKRPKESHKKLH
jgi:hypothetical protein